MRAKKVLSVLLATAVLSAMCAGCGGGGGEYKHRRG